jgi:hypothetical protein
MIVAAAIKFPYQDPHHAEVKDLICFVPHPGRHHNVLHAMHEQFYENPNLSRTDDSYKGEVQGFLTDTGEFLNRGQALKHVLDCGQHLLKESARRGEELFSEDLW